jgi:hypothetical protein
MSTHLITRPSQRSPLTEVRAARMQRALQTSAVVSGIVGVTSVALALVTIGLGA